MAAKFTVLSAVLCEEVRRDISGSGIVIGATNRGQNIPDDEYVLPRIGFYIEAVSIDVEDAEFRLRESEGEYCPFSTSLNFPYKEEALKNETEIDFSTAEINVQLMLNQQNVLFKKSGTYVLEARVPGDSWFALRTYLFPRQSEDYREV